MKMRILILSIISIIGISAVITGCADSGTVQTGMETPGTDLHTASDVLSFPAAEAVTKPESKTENETGSADNATSGKKDKNITVSETEESEAADAKTSAVTSETTSGTVEIGNHDIAEAAMVPYTEAPTQAPTVPQTEAPAPVPVETPAPTKAPEPAPTIAPVTEPSTAPTEPVYIVPVPDTFEYRLANGTASVEEMRQYILDGVNYTRTTGQNRMGISYCPMTLNDVWTEYAQWYVEYLIADDAARQSIAEGPDCHSRRIGWHNHNEGIFQVAPEYVEDSSRYMPDHCFLYGDDLNEIGIGVAYYDGCWFGVVQTWYNSTLPELPTK